MMKVTKYKASFIPFVFAENGNTARNTYSVLSKIEEMLLIKCVCFSVCGGATWQGCSFTKTVEGAEEGLRG